MLGTTGGLRGKMGFCGALPNGKMSAAVVEAGRLAPGINGILAGTHDGTILDGKLNGDEIGRPAPGTNGDEIGRPALDIAGILRGTHVGAEGMLAEIGMKEGVENGGENMEVGMDDGVENIGKLGALVGVVGPTGALLSM